MKTWRIIKLITYILSAIAIFVMRETLVENLKYLIGTLMIVYGLEQVLVHLLTKKRFDEHNTFFWGAVEVILGFIVLLLVHDYATICVLWAVWSILREAHEIEEYAHKLVHGVPRLFGFLESIIVIIFSITLILEPGEHHAGIHVILLCFELLTTVTFPILEELYIEKKGKKAMH